MYVNDRINVEFEWMDFPEIGLAHGPKIEISKKWMGFPVKRSGS